MRNRRGRWASQAQKKNDRKEPSPGPGKGTTQNNESENSRGWRQNLGFVRRSGSLSRNEVNEGTMVSELRIGDIGKRKTLHRNLTENGNRKSRNRILVGG